MTTQTINKVAIENPFIVGDIVQYSFGTISVVLKVVKATAKSITVQECETVKDGHQFVNEFGHEYDEVDINNLQGETRNYRLRKDGTFRIGSYVRAPRITKANPHNNGKYYRMIDLTA